MALWHCTKCTAAYSVGAPACPQCGGTDHTDDAVPQAVDAEQGPELADLPPGDVVEPKPTRR